MGIFRFKRFTVSNERSAMKVNTDGVLLGAAVTLHSEDRSVLDIGTGTGTIALMVAQRLADLQEGCEGRNIVGLEIDKDSADEAALNFSSSPWAVDLHSVNMSLADYVSARQPGELFDVIVSNPPYFESSLKAPDERRRNSRHADSLSYKDIFQAAGTLLEDSGRISLILPAGQETDVVREAASAGFYPFRIVRVNTVPRKLPSRVIMEFSGCRGTVIQENLTIQEKGTYTGQYRFLVQEFLFI